MFAPASDDDACRLTAMIRDHLHLSIIMVRLRARAIS